MGYEGLFDLMQICAPILGRSLRSGVIYLQCRHFMRLRERTHDLPAYMWACALPMLAVTALPLVVTLPWNASLVQAPAVSVLDAVVYIWAGFFAARRTHLLRTGLLAAGITSLFGVALVLAGAAFRDLTLLLAPFSKPFIFVILLTISMIALGFGLTFGAIGALAGSIRARGRRPL